MREIATVMCVESAHARDHFGLKATTGPVRAPAGACAGLAHVLGLHQQGSPPGVTATQLGKRYGHQARHQARHPHHRPVPQ